MIDYYTCLNTTHLIKFKHFLHMFQSSQSEFCRALIGLVLVTCPAFGALMKRTTQPFFLSVYLQVTYLLSNVFWCLFFLTCWLQMSEENCIRIIYVCGQCKTAKRIFISFLWLSSHLALAWSSFVRSPTHLVLQTSHTNSHEANIIVIT